MKQVSAVFKREFFGYFRSPIGYVLLIAVVELLVGLTFFLSNFYEARVASLQSFFRLQPWIFLFIIPAVGMRLWSEEKKNGTWELIFTLPITTTQAVFGKFLAGWLFICIGLALTFPMALTVEFLGDPDWGPIWTGYFGSALMAGAFLAISSLTSALTRNQVISFVISTLILLCLCLFGYALFSDFLGRFLPVSVVDAVANFSFVTRFDSFIRGLVVFKDLIFFVSLSIVALLINVLVLER